MKIETNEVARITQIEVKGMWGRADVTWENVDPQVNILVGSNGSGKSTLLRLINSLYINDTKTLNKDKASIVITTTDNKTIKYPVDKTSDNSKSDKEVLYISTFDAPTRKKSDQSQLTQELDMTLYQRSKDCFSFTDYRMKMTNLNVEISNAIKTSIVELFAVIDSFFMTTDKKIGIDEETSNIVFTIKSGEKISPEDLSSGEKQLLLILFKVFLKEDKPFLLMMDEPEISLHIEWQNKLIDAILQLNKNCQVILSTHSPSIFADGWGDKLVFMDDIVK